MGSEQNVVLRVEIESIAEIFRRGIDTALRELQGPKDLRIVVSEDPQGAEYFMTVRLSRNRVRKMSFFGPAEVNEAFIASSMIAKLRKE